jgi:hypothetical protein
MPARKRHRPLLRTTGDDNRLSPGTVMHAFLDNAKLAGAVPVPERAVGMVIDRGMTEALHQLTTKYVILAEQADIGEWTGVDIAVDLAARVGLFIDHRYFDTMSRGSLRGGHTRGPGCSSACW